MSARRIVLALSLVGVVAGSVAPALADDGSTRVCVNATHDKNHPGPAPLCVWVPVDVAGNR
jgi:hypothetical protein